MRTMIRLKLLLVSAILGMTVTAQAGDQLKGLSLKLADGMAKETNKKVAVLSFPYHDGAFSEGSTITAERLTTYLVESKKVEVIERHLLAKVLSEAKLGMTGFIDEASAQKLGTVLGVSAIVCGTLSDLEGEKTEINARIISASTGKILSAGKIVVKRDWAGSPVKPDPDPIVVPPIMPPGKKPLVQIAVLLDTSNSMDGLISQAKSQLWKIVNELASAQSNGQNPVIQVALFEYGNNSISPNEQFVRQVLPFTTDLDLVSDKLFKLTTYGGDEYCGTVILNAVKNLAWSSDDNAYKAIFIAGNEPFTQGPVQYGDATALAVRKGILVNTIFCGQNNEGINTRWRDGALAGRGDYMNIDSNYQIVTPTTPYDDDLSHLNTEINATYIAYGSHGTEMQSMQTAQERNAQSVARSGAVFERAKFKATAQYSAAASRWDVVSKLQNNEITPSQVKKEELPPELRGKSDKEIESLLNEKLNKRKELQAKINDLSQKRQQYLTEAQKNSSVKTFDAAILESVRKQAAGKQFKFGK